MTETKYTGIKIDETKQFEGPTEEVTEAEVKQEIKRIVSSPVRQKKVGRIERLVKGIIGPDGLPRIGKYLAGSVVGPAIKDTIVKSIQEGIAMMVYGGNNTPNGSQQFTRNQTTQYNNMARGYNRNQPTAVDDPFAGKYANKQPSRPQAQQLYAGTYVNQYLITDRDEAQSILNALMDSIFKYGQVSVSMYYQLMGIQTVFTDNSFGWTNLAATRITPYQGSYIIDLPVVEVL